MSAPIVERVSEHAAVSAVALFGQSATEERGLGTCTGQVEQLARAARRMFREARPHMNFCSLSFEGGRVVLFPQDETSVLFVRGTSALDVEALFRFVRACSAQVEVAPVAAAPSEVPLTPAQVVDAVNVLALEFRNHIGGPVIRNYFRKSQTALMDEHPVLATCTVDLKGQIATTATEANVVPALGAWLFDFLERAGTIAPIMHDIDVRLLVRELEPALQREGFFDKEGTRK